MPICTHIHILAHARMQTCSPTCTYAYIHTHIHSHTHTHLLTHTHTLMRTISANTCKCILVQSYLARKTWVPPLPESLRCTSLPSCPWQSRRMTWSTSFIEWWCFPDCWRVILTPGILYLRRHRWTSALWWEERYGPLCSGSRSEEANVIANCASESWST